jgi:peptide/nickel transport system substrate-binding protein
MPNCKLLRRAKSAAALGAAVALVGLIAAGCGAGGANTSQATSSEQPAHGGTLRVGAIAEVTSLDPLQSISPSEGVVLDQVVESLYRQDSKAQPELWLASSVKKSSDLTRWTFGLRSGVNFSNGKPLTAADVVFSLNRARKSEYFANIFESITSVKAVSPTEVMIATNVPFPEMPTILSGLAAGVIPDNFGGVSEEDFVDKPVGTGPFVVKSWKRGQAVTLSKNDNYWKKGLPYLDEIVVSPIPEEAARVTQLKAGNVDLAMGPPFAALKSLEESPDLKVLTGENAWVNIILLNSRNPLLSDKRTREAVNLAMNRDDIAQAAFHGFANPAMSFFPLFLNYADASIPVPDQNVQKAKALLDEAVADVGEKPSFTLQYVGEEETARNAAQVTQQDLEEAGFKIKLEPLDIATLVEVASSGKYDLTMFQSGAGSPDAAEYASFVTANEYMWSGAPDGELKAILQKAGEAIDPKEREKLFVEFQTKMVEDGFVQNQSDSPLTWASAGNVVGFAPSPAAGVTHLMEVGFSE